jgi:MoxR-like ATPase
VSAIQTENAVILLDEISRAHPEAWNILMTVLDPNQKYLRLDEKDNSPTIKVANNVSFIATANIGNDYTSTRTMDRALLDRFITVEMDVLNKEEETTLLTMLYPTADKGTVSNIAEIADITRKTVRSENPRISTSLSTRATVEMGSLLVDGFNLQEIAEVAIYPFYSEDGGVESERTYMKQLVQKYITTTDKKLFDTNDANPF